MNYYDDSYNYTKDVEDEVDKIRAKALKIVQSINPKISCVIDPYSISEYCERQWDYPGAWYVYFKYPARIRSEAELIDKIVKKALRFYLANNKEE